MNNFLENLKKGLETGDYNSEAAKKIMEISDLSETKKGSDFEKKLEKSKPAPVSEEVALEANRLAELAFEIEKKNANTYKMFAIIENFEKELNDAFFKLKEYYDLVKLRLNNEEELTELETELLSKVTSVIDLDQILSIRMSSETVTYLTKVNSSVDVDKAVEEIVEESGEISEISEVEKEDSENDEQINLYKKL